MENEEAYNDYVNKLDSVLRAYRIGALTDEELHSTWEVIHDLMIADYCNGQECLEGLIEDLHFRCENPMH